MPTDRPALTPEARLAVGLSFPIRNTDGEAEAMGRMIAKQIREAVAEEREACAKLAADILMEADAVPRGPILSSTIWIAMAATRIPDAIRARGDVQKVNRDAD